MMKKAAELTDEQIKAIANREECLRPAQGDGYELDEVAFARAILAFATQGAEPYGYVTTDTRGMQHFFKSSPYLDTAVECVEVYTAPPPTAEVKKDG